MNIIKKIPSIIFTLILFVISSLYPMGKKSSSLKKDPKPLIIWNGEEIGTRANGWAAPKEEDKGPTVSTISVTTQGGYESKKALCWSVKGAEWKGFGWNWFGWWPPDAGTDVSNYSYITFYIRFEFDKKDLKKIPQLGNLTFNISCSADGGKRSTDVNVLDYTEEDLLDCKWHKIKIPLKDLLDNEAAREFDVKSVWEFGMGLWTADSQDFKCFIDTVTFE